ncbi:MAG: AAA family ATPase [Vicinamibacterales bacterium]|nr:AAA family ATPase [Vicinamibacterales bacterium]
MYESFYGLAERPFELTVRPRFVFLSPGHREALAALHYGVSARRALTLVLGEAGTGKTTLVYAAMDTQRRQNVTPVYLNNPTLTRAEFLEWLGSRFKLRQEVWGSKVRLLDELELVLSERRRRGNPWALMLDEAQSLPDELLEEVRLLTNLERDEEKLLPVVMLGQPELAERLDQPAMRHLRQRVAVRCTLGPLSLRETAAYVAKRVSVAGGDGLQVFTREAVELIHQRSGGIPRTINVICDNALLAGFALGRRPVDRDVVAEASADLGFEEAAPAAAPPTPATPSGPGGSFAPPPGPTTPQGQAAGAPALVPVPARATVRAPLDGQALAPVVARRRKRFFFF